MGAPIGAVASFRSSNSASFAMNINATGVDAKNVDAKNQARALVVVAVLLLVITAWNRARGAQGASAGLYYLPIGLAALWLWWPLALLTAGAASLGTIWAALPLGLASLRAGAGRPDAALDVPLFFVFAILVSGLRRNRNTVEGLVSLDPLSNLLHPHGFLRRLGDEVKRAREGSQPLAILLLDVDNLKVLNLDLGRERGDAILREVAAIVRASIRDVDVAGRYHEAQFAVVLPETPPQGARLVAERIRKGVESWGVENKMPVTASIGMVDVDSHAAHEYSYLLGQADEALYEAKRTGRNRVVAFDPEMQG